MSNDSRCLEDETRFLKNRAGQRMPAIPTNEMFVNCLFTYYVAREKYTAMVITSSSSGVSLRILSLFFIICTTEFDITYTENVSTLKMRHCRLYRDGATREM